MKTPFRPLAATAALALLLAPAGAARAGERGAPPTVMRTLAARLGSGGRAEAVVSCSTADPLTGAKRRVRGRLALEPPDRARLDFTASGERITLRGDGGEWLQPGTRQLVVLPAGRAAAALRWWAVLFGNGPERPGERPLRGGGYALTSGAEQAADSARVWLGADGLPARLEITDAAGEPMTFRMSGWRFLRARGRPAFVLTPPPGFAVVDLP